MKFAIPTLGKQSLHVLDIMLSSTITLRVVWRSMMVVESNGFSEALEQSIHEFRAIVRLQDFGKSQVRKNEIKARNTFGSSLSVQRA